MSRAIWIYEGNEAPYAQLKANGITDPYYSVRDQAITLKYLNDVRVRGFSPGLYGCSQGEGWPAHTSMSGPDWADWMYEKVQKQIAPGTSGGFPKVDLNCETDDVEWLLAMLTQWRRRSPKRVTAWSPAAHKAALWADFATELVGFNITIRPQCYVGDMERVESAAEVFAWASIGIPLERIEPFLDAKQLGHWWYGAAFGSLA